MDTIKEKILDFKVRHPDGFASIIFFLIIIALTIISGRSTNDREDFENEYRQMQFEENINI